MLKRIYLSLRWRIWYVINKSKFKHLGTKSFIHKPLSIEGIKNISVGNNVYVAYKTWLAAMPHTGFKDCELIIGDGCKIGNFNHIYATKSIIFGNNVLTADKVYISDNLHSYEDISIPILHQPVKQIGTVTIGENSWIGENVCIMGANIGKHCVIGANSVVIKDIPDYCVAVGTPANVIKQYCFQTNTWIKTN
ncbi:acyltransferase [Flavobacterium sp. MC2016-06]|jgi:acetyltransferase-like isoleucine patch superfamily enzyme|uniref:acyltransferase n=1 Tax=Flavobacterium sp. MC2016-06 TaxID=2676308 RepID=UPI0012BAACBA|nr:acyltransferase [Flavobacterium sp. MC2016-06]MBU3858641.1 acyltransferase [Flavobacterium sp. MC2016-06]